jgi:hypothetical protein
MSVNDEELLQQAQLWGFCCEMDGLGRWTILPTQPSPSWSLSQRGDRWVLGVEGTAQVSFYADDAVKFLERRRLAKG